MKKAKTVYKLITLGDTFAGKSCIIRRFIDDEFENLSPTIGVDFSAKDYTINNKTIKLQVYDTSGQEQFRSITSNYYKKADGILLIFDLTRVETYKNIEYWIKEMKDQSDDMDKVGIVLLGNKADLKNDKKIEIKEGITLAKTLNTKYFETSALSGDNIKEAFQYLVEDIIRKKKEESDNDGVVLDNNIVVQKGNTKKCCSK